MKRERVHHLGPYAWIMQGIYYVLTGIWSIVGVKSFQKVTGPKVDVWLVKTVGVLVTAIGATLISGGLRREPAPEMPVLATGSALGLAGISTWYALRGRISKVYLLDTLAELGLVGLWLVLRRLQDRAV